jgi:hypothetical protein
MRRSAQHRLRRLVPRPIFRRARTRTSSGRDEFILFYFLHRVVCL